MPVYDTGQTVMGGASNQGAVLDIGEYDGKSCLLDSTSRQYLSRTPSSDGNRKTWTFSCWLKRHKLGQDQWIFNSHEAGAPARPQGINFTTADKLNIFVDLGATYRHVATDAVFRDTSAWYHIVGVFDSTATLLADRMLLYVNGELQATTVASSLGTVPALDTDYHINDQQHHIIGAYAYDPSTYYNNDFTIAGVAFVDGQALDPSVFGHYSTDTGAWVMEEFPVAEAAASGGTESTNGEHKVHKFTANSTLTVTKGGLMEYLVVGGGGSGAHNNGGGGAGGFRTGLVQVPAGTYSITVGDGGTGDDPADVSGDNGDASIFHTITANGGGNGGIHTNAGGAGGSGGGGSGYINNAGGAGNIGNFTPSEGNAGGTGYYTSPSGYAGAGGGGAGAVGANASAGSGGAGGAGLASDIIVSGTDVMYAGGGGGHGSGTIAGTGAGGTGGGGAGGVGGDGTVNTGGGGGSGGGSGGSGIVVVRYFSPTQSLDFGTNGFLLDFQKSGGIERGGETEFTLTSGTVLQRTAANDSSAYFEHVLTGDFRFDWQAGASSGYNAGDSQKIGIIPATQRASWNHATGAGGSSTNWYVNFGATGGSDGQAFEDGVAESHTAVTYSTSTVFSLRRESGSIKLYVDGVADHTYGTTSTADMVFFYGAGEKVVTGTITNFSIVDDGNGNSGDFYTLGLGNDVSGNNNDWSIIEGAIQSIDTPVNNFCTLNINDMQYRSTNANPSLLKGGLTVESTTTSYWQTTVATMSLPVGKWYFEFKLDQAATSYILVGFIDPYGHLGASSVGFSTPSQGTAHSSSIGFNTHPTDSVTGLWKDNSRIIAPTTDYTSSNIFQYAIDTTGGDGAVKIWVGVDDTWLGSGSPEPDTGTDAPITNAMYPLSPAVSILETVSNGVTMNFGNPIYTITSGNTDDNGKGNFEFVPPTDFLALCTANLPEIEIGQEEDDLAHDYFNTVIYTGNDTSGHSITGMGFSPDLLWIQPRSNGDNGVCFDSVRGNDRQMKLNEPAAEDTHSPARVTLESDGFDLDTTDANYNGDTRTYVAHGWLAGEAIGTGDFTQGTIASTAQRNTDAGFSIVSYTGTGSAGTIGHGLSKAPEFIIFKNRDSSAYWTVYHVGMDPSAPEEYQMDFDGTGARYADARYYNDTAPTATVMSVNDYIDNNENGDEHMAYCWHSVEGYSKFGGYEGNQNDPDGQFVYTGFPVGMVIIRNIDSTANWEIFDNKRSPVNEVNDNLRIDNNNAESTSGGELDFLSNGFKLKQNYSNVNDFSTFIYMAFSSGTGFKYSTAL